MLLCLCLCIQNRLYFFKKVIIVVNISHIMTKKKKKEIICKTTGLEIKMKIVIILQVYLQKYYYKLILYEVKIM